MTYPTRKRFLAEARSQIGVKERPKGSNRVKYTAWYRMVGPWCAMFLSWVAWRAGATKIVPRFAYTPAGANWFRAKKRWGRTPRSGAIVFYEFPGMGRICHVGVVEAVKSGGLIVAIEGNTDDAGGRTGGQVMRRTRSQQYVAGYGYPRYMSEATAAKKARAKKRARRIAAAAAAAAAVAVVVPATQTDRPTPKPKPSATASPSPRPIVTPTPKASPKPTPKPKPAAKPYVLRRVLIQGASGGDVRRMQAVVGVPRAQRDGQMGPSTVRYVKRWQRSKRLIPDGAFGKASTKKAGWKWIPAR